MAIFSRTTIIEAIQAYGFRTHASMDMFELRFELERETPAGAGLEIREANIIRHLINHPDETGPGFVNLIWPLSML